MAANKESVMAFSYRDTLDSVIRCEIKSDRKPGSVCIRTVRLDCVTSAVDHVHRHHELPRVFWKSSVHCARRTRF